MKKKMSWHIEKLKQLKLSIEENENQLIIFKQNLQRKTDDYLSYRDKIKQAEQKGLLEFDINSKEI